MSTFDPDALDAPSQRPWIVLQTSYDVEMWIDNFSREMQRMTDKPHDAQVGICFELTHGGEIFVHTTSEGEVVLDVPEDAHWVHPLIEAATHAPPPKGNLWHFPADQLTQLILGLTTLIASSRPVFDHDFGLRRW
jgi:hypothetical protein